jgi:peptidyl-prolyl cis-trans isomerase SurA
MLTRCLIFGCFLLTVIGVSAGEMLDRVVVKVNDHVLLQSDLEDEVRYECFIAHCSLQEVTPSDRKAALDRLIDQELLRQQMRVGEIKTATTEEVEKQLAEMRTDYAQNQPQESWSAALSRYQVSEDSVRVHIRMQLDQLRLVDSRLRPSIQIDAADVENYYKQQLLPELVRSGAQQVTLAEATGKIRELLTQQKMNQSLSSWLEALHSQAQIRLIAPDTSHTLGEGQ